MPAEPTTKSSSRPTTYVTRACDCCRKSSRKHTHPCRKLKCNGDRPVCDICSDRGWSCTYDDVDRRRSTRAQSPRDLQARMDRFEDLLKDVSSTLVHMRQGSSQPQQNDGPGVFDSGEADNSYGHLAPQVTSAAPQSVTLSNILAQPQHPALPPLSVPVPIPPSRPGRPSSSSPFNNPNVSPGHASRSETIRSTDQSKQVNDRFGPSSLWSHRTSWQRNGRQSPHYVDSIHRPAVDWSKNLPREFRIDMDLHNRILELFAAYYAPWTVLVDMPAFMEDLDTCNRGAFATETRTSHYSPLCHNCVLYFGLSFMRSSDPDIVRSFEREFMPHASTLLLDELDQVALGSLRGYQLFAQASQYCRVATHAAQTARAGPHSSTGYLLGGLIVAGVNASGLSDSGFNTDPNGPNVDLMVFWTMYIQDTIRALSAGRRPMLPHYATVPLPPIQHSVDSVPWIAPRISKSSLIPPAAPGARINGSPSMRSTALHWTARLILLLRELLAMVNASAEHNRHSQDYVTYANIALSLDQWYQAMPFQPVHNHLLPHVLQMHLLYHQCCIIVHRQFYRSEHSAAAQKCNAAAKSILNILQLFEDTHGMQHAHHMCLNVIFAAGTIFLLSAVSPGDDAALESDLRDFQRCTEYMGHLGLTWLDALRAREVMMDLKAEYHIDKRIPQGLDTNTDQTMDNLQSWFVNDEMFGMVNWTDDVDWNIGV